MNQPQFRLANQPADYDLVIVGSGPAGLSAASRAEHRGNRYLVLEAEPHIANTIHQYQKRKFVMAEPARTPLRSGLSFREGRREEVLDTWRREISEQGLQIRHGCRVTKIDRLDTGCFELSCGDGFRCTARGVVLAIGVQGNIRTLGVPGEDLPGIQYTLEDPGAHTGEAIVVVGTGDSGIENALALAEQNAVTVLNRGREFNSCKEANRNLLLAAEKTGQVSILYSMVSNRVERGDDRHQLQLVVDTEIGEERLRCDRIIARLGATPPRRLLEGFGIEFSGSEPSALPALSEQYESNVPGLYVIGALAGCPLIKQAMNQGYEVVDTLNGVACEPADEPLLREILSPLLRGHSVAAVINHLTACSELFRALSRLQAREMLLESHVYAVAPEEVILRKDDYTNTFFTVATGSVQVLAEREGKTRCLGLQQGSFFGEMGLIAGRRRAATVIGDRDCVVIETPRRTILRLMSSSVPLAKLIDTAFMRNTLITHMKASGAGADDLLADGVEVRKYKAGERIFSEGDEADGLYVVRRGSVTLTRGGADAQMFVAYVQAGDFFGETALTSSRHRNASATANVLSEMIVLTRAAFMRRMASRTHFAGAMEQKALERSRDNVVGDVTGLTPYARVAPLIREGLGEATNFLVIDETRCIQCDNCQTACAETHEGVARMQRASGPTHGSLHLPLACRHCEHPHCMQECPPNALSRGPDGEVFIADTCIGCGNCERNCPYGAITMAPRAPPRRGGGLLWLLFGLGNAPGERAAKATEDARKVALKCDLCSGLKGGPACVRSCPTGAAFRMAPNEMLDNLTAGAGKHRP